MGRWSQLGPGLLFAGAAIGTSHLVQATRAGALYGLGLLLFVLLANALKYPSFRAGPAYAAATGHSLLTGYRRQGSWALALIVLTQLPVHVIILAASAVTCAGLLGALGIDLPLGTPRLRRFSYSSPLASYASAACEGSCASAASLLRC
jgi:Mn2+/Fe2+ NRAMP family transporter